MANGSVFKIKKEVYSNHIHSFILGGTVASSLDGGIRVLALVVDIVLCS